MSKRRSKRISTLGARLTSMVSVALVLVLLGLAAMIGLAGATIQDEVKRNIGFVAVMDKECTAEQLNAMKTCLLSQPAVKSFAFSSAEDILASESEYMGQGYCSYCRRQPL